MKAFFTPVAGSFWTESVDELADSVRFPPFLGLISHSELKSVNKTPHRTRHRVQGHLVFAGGGRSLR